MSRCSASFIRGAALMLALMVSGAPLHASEEVPRFDFSTRSKLSQTEAEAVIREAARKLCAVKQERGGSRWGYKAYGAVRESCGLERRPPPPFSSDQRFELWTGCRPMNYFVNVDGDAEEFGLTSENVKAAVESRLRAARLHTTESLDFPLRGAKGLSQLLQAPSSPADRCPRPRPRVQQHLAVRQVAARSCEWYT